MHNRHILRAPAIAMLAFCALTSESACAETTAHADRYQLYGTLDSGIFHTRSTTAASGKTRHTELQGSGHADTLWGLRGRETLHSGRHVQFTLEAGFDSDSGAGSGFTLQSWLGIGDSALGELRLGKQASAGQDFMADLAIGNWKDFGIDALLRASDNMSTATHIRWQSPAWQGWQTAISYRPDNNTAQAAWRTRSAAVRHENNAWLLAASVEQGARLAGQALPGPRLRPGAWHIGARHEGESIRVAAAWAQMRNGFVSRNGGGVQGHAALEGLGPPEFIQGGRLRALYGAIAIPAGRGEWQWQAAWARPRWRWQESGAAAQSIRILSFGYLYSLSARTTLYAFAAAGSRYDMHSVARFDNPRSRRVAFGMGHHF